MTYTPQISEETHVLLVVELTGLTLYYADRHLSMSDGNFYEGRLTVSTLQRAFSSWTEPKQRQSTLTVTLRDEDMAIRALLEGYAWGLRRAKVYVGRGRDLGDYVLDFDGIIKFPGGISYDNRKVVIRLRDARDKDWKMLPEERFFKADYPNLQDYAAGMPIPIAYGDFSGTAVPVVCTDITVNEFKIAGHAIKAITQVYKNGVAVSHTNEDLNAATFRIAAFDQFADTVTVKFQGKADGDGDLMENPIDILRDIQEEYVGIAAANFDDAAYALLANELSTYTARRYLNRDINSNTLIEELGIECAFDLLVENGLYTPLSRTPSQAYDTLYTSENIVRDSFSVEMDPEKLYANRLNCLYAFDPASDGYTALYLAENTDQQTVMGQIIPREIQFNWLWQEADVTATAARAMLLYSNEIRVVRFTGLGEAILEQLGNRPGLSFANFAERPLLIREITKNYSRRSCDIAGYDALSFAKPGYWTADDAPDWAAATAEQKLSQGFFTDDDGYADPGDDESKVSHWW